MSAPAPATSPRSRRAMTAMWCLLSGLPVVTPLLWWAGGLRTWQASSDGFGERLVTCDFQDTGFEDALALLHPGAPLRFAEPGLAQMVVTLKVEAMPEHQAALWVARLTDTRLVLRADGLEISGAPWLEQSYRVVDSWLQRRGHWHLWPNR